MPDEENSSEKQFKQQRITNILINHWSDVKGAKRYPSEADLDPAILEPLLDSCFLIQAEGIAEGKYQYKYLGKNIMNAYGSELTYSNNGSKENPLTQKDKLLQVLEHGYPITDEGSFINIYGDTIKYRQCLAPLSNDGENIDSIFGGMRLKIFKRDDEKW